MRVMMAEALEVETEMGGEGSSLIIAILWPFYRLYQHAIKKKYPLFYVYIYTGSAGALLTKKRMKAFS